jgi:hypothetical protein
MFGYSKSTAMLRRVIVVFVLAFFGIVLPATALVIVGLSFIGLKHAVGPFGRSVANPSREFTQYTGLTWPVTARVVAAGDDHRGLQNDGEFYLVFDTDPYTVSEWLAKTPPWGTGRWQSGGVPNEIAKRLRFSQQQAGPASHVEAMMSGRVAYCAEDRNPASPWSNGCVLAIDATSARVFVCRWDF